MQHHQKNRPADGESLKRDENGLIIEPLRIVTHSMGAAYGKGFVQAIIDFAKKNQKITNGLIVSEYDFAPFQPGSQKSVNGVTTYQDSHTDDKIAGFQKINGATPIKQSNKKGGHSIESFLDDIKNLPEGNYKYVNGTFIKNNR